MHRWLCVMLLVGLSGCSPPLHGQGAIAHLDPGWSYRTGLGWAPDGNGVVVMAEPEPKEGETPAGWGHVNTVSATGASRGDLGRCSSRVAPRYAPDARHVLLLTEPPGDELVLRSVTDGTDTSLYKQPEGVLIVGAALSPDGRFAAITERTRAAPLSGWRLRVLDTRGSTPKTVWASLQAPMPCSWSPNSRLLLWAVCDNVSDNCGALLFDVSTGKTRTVTTVSGAWEPGDQTWSADSARFSATSVGPTQSVVWTCSIRNGARAQLATLRGGGFCAWSPHGDRIAAFVQDTDAHDKWQSAIYLVDPAGGDPRLLVAWSEGQIRAVSWSPSGDRLAFIRDTVVFAIPVQ